MKILSDEEILKVAEPYVDYDYRVLNIDKAIAIEAQKDTLRQVRELLDGIETGRHPSKPHKTICCMHCGNWDSIDDEIEQAKYEAIQTIKALLEE